MNAETKALLELLSGPGDGEVLPLNEKEIVLGPVSGALLRLEYDPQVPREGVRIRLLENGVEVGSRTVLYGEPFQVGQTWMRILVPQREGR